MSWQLTVLVCVAMTNVTALVWVWLSKGKCPLIQISIGNELSSGAALVRNEDERIDAHTINGRNV